MFTSCHKPIVTYAFLLFFFNFSSSTIADSMSTTSKITIDQIKQDIDKTYKSCVLNYKITEVLGNNPYFWQTFSRFSINCLKHPLYCRQYAAMKFNKKEYQQTMFQFSDYFEKNISALFIKVKQYEANPTEPLQKFANQVSIDLSPIGTSCNNIASGIQNKIQERNTLIKKILN